jgi:hypothetical protein
MIPKFILSNSLGVDAGVRLAQERTGARIEAEHEGRFVTAGCKLGSVFSSEDAGLKLARVKAAVQAFATYTKEIL